MFTHLITLESAWFPALLDILLKSTVLLALAALAALACRRASAAQRHLVWMLAVIGVLLLPVLATVLPAWHVLRLPEWKSSPRVQAVENRPTTLPRVSEMPSQHPLPSAAVTSSTPVTRVETPNLPASTPQAPPPTVATASAKMPVLPWYVWVTFAWGIGAVLVLARWVYGHAVTRRILMRSLPASEDWAAEVPAGVRLLVSDDLAMPVVVGIRRPTILLPAQAEEWPEERRRMVLLHECAHIQRRDLSAHLLAYALYWINPLIWLAAHRLRVEREAACDDLVLGTDVRPSDYATHLLAIAGALQNRPLAGIAMAHSSKVGKRIKGVLDGRKNRRGVSRWMMLVLTLLCLPLFIALAMAEEPTDKPLVTYADTLVQIAFAQKQIMPQGHGTSLLYDSPYPVISPDGSRILFIPNRGWEIDGKVAGGDEVFFYRRDTGQVENLNIAGRSQGRFRWWLAPTHFNRMSWDGHVTASSTDPEAVISPDGRIMASFKDTLVTADDPPSTTWKCYLTFLDRETGGQERVEVPNAHGNSMGDARPLSNLQFSQDGRYLAFSAQFGKGWQDPQGGGGYFTWSEVMVYDRTTKQLAFANVNARGERVSVPCNSPRISADGHYVMFSANEWAEEPDGNYPAEITTWKKQQRMSNEDTALMSGVYLYDTQTIKVRRYSELAKAVAASHAWFYPITSGDGRFVVTNVVKAADKKTNEYSEILMHDTKTGKTLHVSEGGRAIHEQLGLPYYAHEYPTISKDGRFISYITRMSNVKLGGSTTTPDDPKWNGIINLAIAIQVYDRETQKTSTVLLATDLPQKQQIGGKVTASSNATIAADKDGVINRFGTTPKPADLQQPVAGAPYHGLVVSLECAQSYQIGEPVLIKVHEKNTGEQILCYAFYRFPYYYHLYLTDAQGKPVEKTSETATAEYEEDHVTAINRPQSIVTLQPGEKQVRTFDLRQYFKAIPAGSYALQVRRTARDFIGITPGVNDRGALSHPCRFTITK